MQEFQAALFDELDALYPDTDVSKGHIQYAVSGVNGMYAGVHIMLSGLAAGIPVRIEVKGPNRSYKLFELLELPVEVNTGAKLRSEYLKDDTNPYVVRKAPFYIYDVLKPVYNLMRPAYPQAALAFKVPVEYCREERDHVWNIILTQGECTRELTFTVHEYPLTVPKQSKDHFKYVNWFSYSQIAASHHVPMWSGAFWEILGKYIRAAAYSRQNMFAVGINSCIEFNGEGMPVLLTQRLKKLVQTAKDNGIFFFQGEAVAQRKAQLGDDDSFYQSLNHEKIESPEEIEETFKVKAFEDFDFGTKAVLSCNRADIPGEHGEAVLRSIMKQLYRFLEENGLKESWIQCCMDEPNEALEPAYREIIRIVKEEMPGVKIMEPTLTDISLADTMDIWCPSLEKYEQNKAFYDGRIEKGEEVFIYSCLTPGGPYCNRLLDMERLRQVWIGWAPVKYPDIKGFLHWGGNYYSNEGPYARQACMMGERVLEFHPKHAMFLPAGDGAVFFPGENMPLISTRSEAHRMGLEDLCLLERLKEKNPQQAQALVHIVFRGFKDFEKNIETYRKVRDDLFKKLM